VGVGSVKKSGYGLVRLQSSYIRQRELRAEGRVFATPCFLALAEMIVEGSFYG
jgi:hypothetical protein